MDSDRLSQAIGELVEKLAELVGHEKDLAIIGIRTRGVFLAERIRQGLQTKLKRTIPIGILDITLYRDDFSTLASQPLVQQTHLPFDVTDKTVILIDDVIYTGRTIRAALSQIIDFGRPKAIRLVALVDRGLREYPIQPDLCALSLQTSHDETVEVHFNEIDGEEKILLAPLKKGK